MPKTVAVTCQVCLAVLDPDDSLVVAISPPALPHQIAWRVCRLCTLAIVRAAVGSELIEPAEVFGPDLGNLEVTPAPKDPAAPGGGTDTPPPGNGSGGGDSEVRQDRLDGPPAEAAAGPMPDGKCALDCGKPAAKGDIYCNDCRSSLRGQ